VSVSSCFLLVFRLIQYVTSMRSKYNLLDKSVNVFLTCEELVNGGG
jgi:hypothetical protein